MPSKKFKNGYRLHWTKEEHGGRLLVRAFLYDDSDRSVLSSEVSFNYYRVRVTAKADPVEDGLSLCLGLPPMFLHLSSERLMSLAHKLCPDAKSREFGFSFDPCTETTGGPALYWRIWSDVNEWDHRTPFWKDGYIAFWDLLFGRTNMIEREISKQPIMLVMPEGVYQGEAVISENRWVRPRWPGDWLKGTRITMKFPQGVPHPGKGENSWDCEQDAIYEMGSMLNEESLTSALQRLSSYILKRREEHGGKNWKPKSSVRRMLPLPPQGEVAKWECRDLLTGEWSFMVAGTEEWVRGLVGKPGWDHIQIDERPCGCCQAPYGTPCTDPNCPNIKLRRENTLCVPSAQQN